MIVRKDFNTLSQAEIDQFVQAVKAFNTPPAVPKPYARYHNLVDVQASNAHFETLPPIHGTALFLPWQRAFLLGLEQAIQSKLGDPNYGIPYWNWAADSGLPNGIGKIWGASAFGGQGNPVPDGPFAGTEWLVYLPGHADWPGCPNALRRQFGATSMMVTPVQESSLIANSPKIYDSFRMGLEALSNRMRGWVGGHMAIDSDCVNDPVYWLHCANVDRIWRQWQIQNPTIPIGGDGITDATLMPPTLGPFDRVTVGSVLTPAYTYDTMAAPQAPAGLRRPLHR